MDSDTGSQPNEEHVHFYILKWLSDERSYQVGKFGIESDDEHVETFNLLGDDPRPDNWWDDQLQNYYHRAKILSLQTPNGRQALAKFVATAVGMLEACVRVYGPLPEPGVTSGENLDKLRPIK